MAEEGHLLSQQLDESLEAFIDRMMKQCCESSRELISDAWQDHLKLLTASKLAVEPKP